ncbi:MAG TPA: hypothetical protein VGB18_00555, partial [Candidatus Thermoplasmatota archaeon]
MTAAEFDEVRRQLNLDNIALLQKKLPGLPKILLPLHKEEVVGLKGLEIFEEEFFKSLARTVKAEAR